MPELKDQFAKYKQQGVGINMASYVGYGTIRKLVIGNEARAPTAKELTTEKELVAKGMCEGVIGLSTGLFYAPRVSPRPMKSLTWRRKRPSVVVSMILTSVTNCSDSIGIIASTKEVLQIGREANIPVHFSHIKALGKDVWGKSAEVIKLIDDAKAAGQNVTANHYPWTASQTYLNWLWCHAGSSMADTVL